jgi:hypothetical protein
MKMDQDTEGINREAIMASRTAEATSYGEPRNASEAVEEFDAAEQASYEQQLTNALAESRSDFEHGRCYTSRESLMQAVKAKREARV